MAHKDRFISNARIKKMSRISIENAIITVTVESVRYVHNFVTNITITDARENALKISPQGGGNGLAYGISKTTPIMLDIVVRDLSIEMLDLYDKAFKDKTRLDFMVFDSVTNARYDINKAVLRTSPINTTISEDESTLDVLINASAPTAFFKYTSVS